MGEETPEEVAESTEEAGEDQTPQETQVGLSFDEVVDQVIQGKWGIGQERRMKLNAAGFDHRLVQAAIVRRANRLE